MECKISVIVPVYNTKDYLKQCLDSIISQTIRDIEIICINDGSTDSSLSILESFAIVDSRIIVVNQENKGVAAARNAGIEKACGEYLVFMDADDWYPNAGILDTLYKKAVQNNAYICGGEFSDYDENSGRVNVDFQGEYFGYTFEREGFIDYSEYQYDFGYQRFLFLRRFICEEELYFPNLSRFQDPPFLIKAMILARRFYAVKMIVYCYRYGHRGSIWTSKKVEDLISGLTIDLTLAAENRLGKLKELTLFRFEHEYENVILQELKCGNEEIARNIDEFFSKLEHEDRHGRVNPFFLKMVQEVFDLSSREQLMQKEIFEKDCRIQRLEQSKTFRIGKIIMFIPQKVYWWIQEKC